MGDGFCEVALLPNQPVCVFGSDAAYATGLHGSRGRESPVAPQGRLALAMIASTSRHLHHLVEQVEQLKAQSGVQRVAEFLATLAPNEHGSCVVALPYDKVLIAARLGLKPESLSRAFAKLRTVGVEVQASHVAVGDIARLRQLAADDRSAIRGSLR